MKAIFRRYCEFHPISACNREKKEHTVVTTNMEDLEHARLEAFKDLSSKCPACNGRMVRSLHITEE